jgi:TonB-linked SusC/RagA family outer membrane protein
MYNDPRNLPAGITIDQWKAYDNKQGDPLDIWLDRLKLLPIEVQNYKDGKTIDWYDQMFQKGLRQDHTISVSGRKEDFSYYLSGGYTNNEGVVVGDQFKTFRFRTNFEAKVASFLTAGLNLQFADRDEGSVAVNWGQMVNASPYGEKFKADGVSLRDSPNDDIGNNTNPFNDSWFTQRMEKTNTLFGSLYVKGDLPLGFSYQVNFTPDFDYYRYFNGVSAKNFRFLARGGVATRIQQTEYHWQLDNLLKWKKSFGEHTIDATFLVNAEKFQSWRSQMDNEGFAPNDNLSYHNIGAGIKPAMVSNDQVSTGDALMARLNYSFMQKYLLTASFRRDGYSAFGTKNPRADFPAIALGWVFSEEKFMQSVKWLNHAKLRFSWGVNGNRDIGRYAALADLQSGKYQYVKTDGTVTLVSQLYVNRLANPDLKWEETTSSNIGFDFAVLNNRLDGSIDLYHKKTNDLLIERALPDLTGFFFVIDNIGQVDNKGIEVAINSVNVKTTNFSWRSSAIFSLNRNEIVHLYEPVSVTDPATGKTTMVERDDIANRWFIGHDINSIWDLKVIGVWQADEAAAAAKYGVRPGDFKIEDVNGDGTFSDADRQFLGSTNPKYQWTLRNEFTIFKNFDFSFMIYSVWGHKRQFNQAKNNTGFLDRQNSYRFKYWTPENPTNEYARLYSSNGSAGFSVYRDPSFIRLSTVSLGYTLPKKLLQKAKFESLKIYASVNNMGVYSPYWTFWDPEYGNVPNEDLGRTNAPTPRYYNLGLNISL